MDETKPFKSSLTESNEEQISEYLDSNPNFLEKYVVANIDVVTLEKWVMLKGGFVKKGHAGE